MRAARSLGFLGLVFSMACELVAANELPSVNLGLTSFLDGAPAPGGPGWYGIAYLQYYQADTFRDGAGHRVTGLPETRVEVTSLVNQLVYQSNVGWLSAKAGGIVLLPAIVHARLDDGLGGLALGEARRGVGDVVFGPFLQWDPVMGARGPVFAHRVELNITAPTGAYDRTRGVNPGSNHWSIEAYWAGTWWATPNWTVSTRLFYLWNGKNDDPAPGRFASYGIAEAHEFQPGQAFHANFATEVAVTPALRLGLNGYVLRQTTETKVDGIALTGSKERVFAIGPGLLYSFSPQRHLYFNAYKESGARNRPEGERYTLRYVHQF